MGLPDLDTSQIGFIAYWSAFDHGVSDITPSETTTAMTSSKEYSNGVDGTWTATFANKNNREINVRVKEDGWIIAWIDRTQEYGTGQTIGSQDLINDWTSEGNSTMGAAATTLATAIKACRDALSNSGSTTWSATDVAYYHFAYPDAANLTIVSDNDDGASSGSIDIGSGTTLHLAIATGRVGNTNNTAGCKVGGKWVLGSKSKDISARDAISNGMVSAGSSSSIEAGNSYTPPCRTSLLVLWS